MRSKTVKFFLFAVSAGFLIFLGQSRAVEPWRGRLFGAAAPMLSRLAKGVDRLQAWLGGASAAKARAWEEERLRLLGEVAERDSASRENEVLREALALRREGEEGVIPARVIGFFRDGREEFLLLNRGAESGIAAGDIVLGKNRVYGGTVSAVGANFSRTTLLSSASQSIDVLVGTSTLRAIARGNNSRELIIDLVPQDAEVKAGDLIVASLRAVGGRSAVLVGEVREARQAENEIFKSVRALHLFNSAEDDVLVILAP